MAERIREETVVQNDVPQQTTKRVVTTGDDREQTAVVESDQSTAPRLVWFVTGILLTLLAFRFALSLLGANRDNGFADFIYAASYPFVAPFFGLFNYKAQYGVSRFEIETVVAMFFYGLVAFGIVQLIKILRKEA